jgi:hypothetical protein
MLRIAQLCASAAQSFVRRNRFNRGYALLPFTTCVDKEGLIMELIISDDFTIKDIHEILVYNYEKRGNMTFEEMKADITKGSDAVRRLLSNNLSLPRED